MTKSAISVSRFEDDDMSESSSPPSPRTGAGASKDVNDNVEVDEDAEVDADHDNDREEDDLRTPTPTPGTSSSASSSHTPKPSSISVSTSANTKPDASGANSRSPPNRNGHTSPSSSNEHSSRSPPQAMARTPSPPTQTTPPKLTADEYASGSVVCDTCGVTVSFRDSASGGFTVKEWDSHRAVCRAPAHPSKSFRSTHADSTHSQKQAMPPSPPTLTTPSLPFLNTTLTSSHNNPTLQTQTQKKRRAKRTEEERIHYLRSDPLVAQFEAYRVLCGGCSKWIRLRPNSTYCSIPWDAHRKSCLSKKGALKGAFAHDERTAGVGKIAGGDSAMRTGPAADASVANESTRHGLKAVNGFLSDEDGLEDVKEERVRKRVKEEHAYEHEDEREGAMRRSDSGSTSASASSATRNVMSNPRQRSHHERHHNHHNLASLSPTIPVSTHNTGGSSTSTSSYSTGGGMKRQRSEPTSASVSVSTPGSSSGFNFPASSYTPTIGAKSLGLGPGPGLGPSLSGHRTSSESHLTTSTHGRGEGTGRKERELERPVLATHASYPPSSSFSSTSGHSLSQSLSPSASTHPPLSSSASSSIPFPLTTLTSITQHPSIPSQPQRSTSPPPPVSPLPPNAHLLPPPILPSHESRRRNASQRAEALRSDPLIQVVEANRVFCRLCRKWVQLRQDSSYCAYPWMQHRGKCTNRYQRRLEKAALLMNGPQGGRIISPSAKIKGGYGAIRPISMSTSSDEGRVTSVVVASGHHAKTHYEEDELEDDDVMPGGDQRVYEKSPVEPESEEGVDSDADGEVDEDMLDRRENGNGGDRVRRVDAGGTSYHQPYAGHAHLHPNHATLARAGKRRRDIDQDADEGDVDMEERDDTSESRRNWDEMMRKKKKLTAAVVEGRRRLSKKRGLADLDSPEGRTKFIAHSIQYLYTITHERTDEICLQALIAYLNAAMPTDKHEDFDAAEVSRGVSAFVRSTQLNNFDRGDNYYDNDDDDYALNFPLQFDGETLKSA